MADHLLNGDDGGDGDIFMYTGGEQEVPRNVRRAKIDESIDTIPRQAFSHCVQLIELEGHDKLKKIEEEAFNCCYSLIRLMNMNGVIEIEGWTFNRCHALCDVDFDRLEIIGRGAFHFCRSLRSINMPYVRRVEKYTFEDCGALTNAVFGEELEGIFRNAFHNCTALRRIAIPLKDNFVIDLNAFSRCRNLSRVDVVGGIHKTISSLHMENWRDDVKEEIESINQTLPDTLSSEMSATINQWIRSVLRDMEHYKTEHKVLLKEAMMLLELALWKAKLLDEEGRKCEAEEKMSLKAKIDKERTRKEYRVTCGANIVIKNVLPFLALK
jgi:hypothetical protein